MDSDFNFNLKLKKDAQKEEFYTWSSCCALVVAEGAMALFNMR